VPGFRVDGCVTAIIGAIVMSLVGWAIGLFLPTPPKAS
jgi:uncharacterized membrane protein YvlD (DUF360 family)